MKTQTPELGKPITSYEGHTRGLHYGEVYTGPAGGKGFLSGRRNRQSPGIGLMDVEKHATLREAQNRAVRLTDW